MHSKLIKELPELVENDVISQDVASKIERYYQSKTNETPNRLFTVFGVLGSVLVGLGLILILAHNWDNFSKTIKTLFAFAPLIVGQVLVGFSILKKKSQTWKEASGVFLFFAVGASIAMVSQIYNIPGNFTNYMLVWILLCVPLIYLLKSHALALLHLVYATVYACNYGYANGSKAPWLFLVLLLLLLPYYINLIKSRPKANITSIFNWLLPISLVITLGAFITKFDELIFLSYIILFGLFYNLGKLPVLNNLKLRQNGYLVLGSFGTVVLLLIASFRWVWEDVLRISSFSGKETTLVIVLFVVALGVLIYLFLKKQVDKFNLFHYIFIIMTMLFFVGLKNDVSPTVITNVLLLVLGINAIKIGVDKMHFGVLNYGLIIITALIFCRFFDTNMSFVIRGLLFVIVGIGFFATNYVMLKKQKSKETKILK
ncbi:DUF2157 domain-containing protein [Lacinutrix sp. Bg11-31]|uniref:DUF2157 domain-containing protein n=1 Tax=Lacinutrix sp. Bg11-31 TaxID=2057808 RepID=UPI000C303FA3|nr:DUF2157 domain-containing protein [Lacinutrix sp. Bg11-31]AUC83589.1 hypothetical protein CW733_16225 [Lacinutrix sp. Bg11-31]